MGAPALAEDPDPAPALTGDWGGARPAMAARGLTFSGMDTLEVLGNVRGGRRTGAVFDGLWQLGVELDLDKLAEWKGATLHGTAIYPHGASLSGKYVGDFSDVSSIDAYDSVRLYEAWLEQTAFDDRFALRVGFMAADAEFCVITAAGTFINSAFGTPATLTGNFPMSSYPYSGLAARLRLGKADGWSLLLAAFDGNVAPGVLADPTPGAARSTEFNQHGIDFALRADEGAMLFAEAGWHSPAPDKEASPAPLGGAVKFGGVYHTDRFGDIRAVTLGKLRPAPVPQEAGSVRGDYALYAIAEREFWRKPNTKSDGLTAFARAALAPAGRNFFSQSAETGVVYQGLFQKDASDSLALGVAWLGLSRDVRSAYRDAGLASPHDEVIIELTYQYTAVPGWTLQPDLQWVFNPGGTGRDALVLGLRSIMHF